MRMQLQNAAIAQIFKPQNPVHAKHHHQHSSQFLQDRQLQLRPKCFELIDDSKIVIASPTAIADRKKNTGSSGLYQNGCSFSGMIRYSVPSEDWCSVERITPEDHQRNQHPLEPSSAASAD